MKSRHQIAGDGQGDRRQGAVRGAHAEGEEGLGQQDIGAQRGHQEASGHADHIALPVAPDRASEDDDVIQGSCEAYWTVGLGMNLGDCKSWPSFVA